MVSFVLLIGLAIALILAAVIDVRKGRIPNLLTFSLAGLPKKERKCMNPFISIKQFVQSEEGATAIEYALMASLIATATVGAQTTLGTTVINMYQNAVGVITAAMS